MKKKGLIESTFLNNILSSLLVFVLTVGILYLTPIEKPLTKLIIAIAIGLVMGTLTNMAISASVRLRKVAIHDELTGLYNNNFLTECKYRAITTTDRQQAKLGIMTISVAELNKIMNSMGQKGKDAVIRYVGEGLTITSRATEYIFHLHDDNFLIFFADINEYNNIKTIKNRLNAFFETPFSFSSQKIFIKLNFGYAVYPDDGEDFDAVLNVAKQRMYVDKNITN